MENKLTKTQKVPPAVGDKLATSSVTDSSSVLLPTQVFKPSEHAGMTSIPRDKKGRFIKRSTALQQDRPQFITIDNESVPVEELAKLWRLNKVLSTRDLNFVSDAVKRRIREQELMPYQAELVQMQKYLIDNKLKMIVLFEGRDAAGKGGTIRAITRHMNQRHYRVVALGKPTERELTQWYYQKFTSHFPSAGEIVLFDRSWYTRAMVERVFGFCTQKEYKNFMLGVTNFEKDIIRQDVVLIKLYFSVTKEVQSQRFDRRKSDPLRQWKLSRVDMQAQDRWNDFTQVKYDMLKQTSIPISPWHILRSDNKHLARLNTMKLILNQIPYKKLNEELDFITNPEIVISGARELELLEAERLKLGLAPHQVIV
ncbi:MAG: polyphosphate kinase 2 [Holophagaceae bacterium]|nr:polyphosphate kinase 2 [Holophagaceae bacterium]